MTFQGYWWFFLAVIIGLFGAGEAYGYFKFGISGTFSDFMTTMGHRSPLWPFAWGLLIGGLVVHFWVRTSAVG